MADRVSTRRTAADRNRGRERTGSVRSRPDQIALWAVAMAVVVLVAAAVSAEASDGTGGVSAGGGGGGGTGSGECRNTGFGTRVLAKPDCGNDAKTLNWILHSKGFHTGVPLAQRFNHDTKRTVRKFQRRNGLAVNGVLRKHPRNRLVRSLPRHRATWYGPGFWGNRTACGQVLRKGTRGVAHRRLPCGTRVVVFHRGRTVRTRVIDRGPYAHGANWDLTQRIANQLRFEGVGAVRVARVR